MGFSVDFSQFEKLIKDMKASEKDFNKFLYDFLLRMAWEVIRETKPKTPHDTGALQNAWAIQTDKVSSKSVTMTNRKGKQVQRQSYTQEGDLIVSGSGKDLAVIISNPMEYATDIEYGHRLVKGKGADKVEVGWFNGVFMLKTSIDNVINKMPAAYDIAFRQFCKSHGIGD